MKPTSHDIQKEFVVLSPEKRATLEPFDSMLYKRLDESYNGFAGHELISCYEFDSDWDTWEIHPEGDEIVMLLSGHLTLVLKNEDGSEDSVALAESGSYVIIPKGAWHTARTTVASKALFITPGEGTLNQESPDT